MGRDLSLACYSCRQRCFNPRAHVGRDLVAVLLVLAPFMFQSTRPRGARRRAGGGRGSQSVSIHAPTWGATCFCASNCFVIDVSIHAPTWGATGSSVQLASRSRVSIHAPTWGATPMSLISPPKPKFQSTRPRGARPWRARCTSSPWSFNPRAHVGRDSSCLSHRFSDMFQSTRPRGARHKCRYLGKGQDSFNPRAHVGRDLSFFCGNTSLLEFQSTRPRGARPNSKSERKRPSMFQSTRPRGARHHISGSSKLYCTFQSTRPRGARRSKVYVTTQIESFNPRAHVGRDITFYGGGKSFMFQSTRPRGARQASSALSTSQQWFQSTRPRGARLSA